MRLEKITAHTLDEFIHSCPYGHFMHTSAWAEVAASRGLIPHMLGLYAGTCLKGTALLLEKKIFRWSTFYIPRGFAIDYREKKILKEMLQQLKQYVHDYHGLYFRFDPELRWHLLNEQAEIIQSFPENEELITFFQENGAHWKGKTIRFSEMSNPRFTFRVSLANDLLAQCHPTTRKILNRGNPYGIEIYKGKAEDLPLFYQVMSNTARQKGIYLEPYEFFANFYQLLAKQDMADLWIAKISLAQLKRYYLQKKLALQEEIKAAEAVNAPKKLQSKKKDLLAQLRKIEKEETQAATIQEETLILSAIITARFKDTVATVHGGNNDILRSLFANYELYYRILQDAQENGYQWVDLFGTEGKVDKNSDVYGIYLFKLRFGGEFDEFIGEFDVTTRPLTAFLIEKALRLRRQWLIIHQHKGEEA